MSLSFELGSITKVSISYDLSENSAQTTSMDLGGLQQKQKALAKHFQGNISSVSRTCLDWVCWVEIYPKTKHMMARILEKAKHCVALMESDVSWLHWS